jgi:Holliday junction resolvasome RuvABC DNA-binding subunit
VENLRLLCRTHNQLEAERVLGRGFMERRRQRPLVNHERQAPRFVPHEADVRAALRTLGYRKAEVNMGLAAAARLPHSATPEDCVRAALGVLRR